MIFILISCTFRLNNTIINKNKPFLNYVAMMEGKRKEYSIDLRKRVIFDRENGLSIRKVAKMLKIPPSSVQYIWEKYLKTKSVANNGVRGRKRSTTPRVDRCIVGKIEQNRRKNAVEVSKELENELNIKLSPQTIRNRLHEASIFARTPRRKPFISIVNKRKRLQWAKEHVLKDDTFWNMIIWSDKSKFNLYGADGGAKVYRRVGEEYNVKCLKATFKFCGGNVMVWGCMSASGVGKIEFIDEKMDQHLYRSILERNLVASAGKLGLGTEFIFQHDNDPKHKAGSVTRYLAANGINVLDWVAQSPDLNPIEHLWSVVEKRMKDRAPKNKNELKELVLDVWSSINQEITSKLVSSMKNRCRAVIEADGGPTRY